MDEARRIKKILEGDISAFNYFVEAYQDTAVTIAYRICSNREEAEDVVQEAFVKAFHNLSLFRQSSKFSTWFFRIVYNIALSRLKTPFYLTNHVHYEETGKEIEDFSIPASMEEEEKKECLRHAMEKLPRDYALLLTLFYLEENSVKDMINITGLSESNIKVKLHRARKELFYILQPVFANNH